MFNRMSHGWELAQESWQVLKLDKSLLVFPLISGIACLIVMISFAVPLYFSDFGQGLFADGQVTENPLAWLLLFLFYFVNY
jgi:hypothetical protein